VSSWWEVAYPGGSPVGPSKLARAHLETQINGSAQRTGPHRVLDEFVVVCRASHLLVDLGPPGECTAQHGGAFGHRSNPLRGLGCDERSLESPFDVTCP